VSASFGSTAQAQKNERSGEHVPRTIVIGDSHGYPWVISNALEHFGFEKGVDRFVYTGDFIDRGPDARGCFELIEQNADVVLVGNHELFVLMGELFEPHNVETLLLAPTIRARVLEATPEERWRCAVAVDGVLITHAGVNERYARAFAEECGSDVERFAEWLNTHFDESLRGSMIRGYADEEGLLGTEGPLWNRPTSSEGSGFLPRLRQVAGHTPVSAASSARLEKRGVFLIDANVYGAPAHDRFRYAVIESGEGGAPARVRIEDSER
jgi:hypothetical protein